MSVSWYRLQLYYRQRQTDQADQSESLDWLLVHDLSPAGFSVFGREYKGSHDTSALMSAVQQTANSDS
jgi:hypothetical protein